MKLYTRRGDDGSTDLFGGQRTSKASLRVETYGTVDELNCTLGLALVACRHDPIRAVLRELQNSLFDLGADLATPHDTKDSQTSKIRRIASEDIDRLERLIDEITATLSPLSFFILPGGGELASRLHLARAVARRAERLCAALRDQDDRLEPALIFLNRISDLLFTLARQANHLDGIEDIPWTGPQAR